MQSIPAPAYQGTHDADEAQAILRRCVHCGFCNATCPTYQLLGDELDGPRGRIYLIKQVLEGEKPTRSTQLHLDRCLTCRNCESTCPSGVDYGHLVEIGRRMVDEQVERPGGERRMRWLLREGLTSPWFEPAVKLGRLARPFLPKKLRDKLPTAPATEARWPTRAHPRKVLLLLGCVQPALAPDTHAATARVLDAAGIQTLVADGAGCCGAMHAHLGDEAGALQRMRANIDAWWPLVDRGEVEAIVSDASGCGAVVKDYAHALAHDADYAERAQRITALARDIGEVVAGLVDQLAPRLSGRARPVLAFHCPCTLQHGQKLGGVVENALRKLGFEVRQSVTEHHLCCGSAGTYSLLQPVLADQLRTRKLAQLEPLKGQVIVSANIGCIQHLQAGTNTPVKHWIEVLDDVLSR